MTRPQNATHAVIALSPADAPLVVDVLVDAFFDYPVMRYVLGESADYRARLELLIGMFVANRALRGDPMAAVFAGSDAAAVITMSYPIGSSNPPAFEQLREVVWQQLGTAASERYERCVAAWSALAPNVPQLHVNMIGVRKLYQRTGLARPLLEHAHQLALLQPGLHGVSLTTELPANVQLYQHFGYTIFDERLITPELTTWGLFRWHELLH